MCGIIGYSGKQQASQVIIDSLKRLEYRGYDSFGICTLVNSHLCWVKDVGSISSVPLDNALYCMPESRMGIGHTRWATHGKVSKVNSHPHLDCTKNIAIVHNGIIENYESLYKQLSDNHLFISETDTEVIPHLIEDYIGQGMTLEESVLESLKIIEGSFAYLALIHDKIVGVKRGMSLLVGVGGDGYYVSSDVIAFAPYAKRYMALEDNEMVVITKDNIEIYDQHGKIIQVNSKPIVSNMNTDKSSYAHYMLKEIEEQPTMLEKSINQDKNEFTNIALDILRARQVIITACGSSRYAALVGRYLFSKVGKKFCDVVMASEFGYFADSVDNSSLILAVSQSGETADVVLGVNQAKQKGAEIISIVNRPNSILENVSNRVINLNCGMEIGVAATKTFLSQLAIFYLLSFSMVNEFDKACADLKAAVSLISKIIKDNQSGLSKLSETLKDNHDFYYIARGINFAVASEGALKLKEISYVHAEGMPAGELKHGTLSLIEDKTPVIVICPDDYTYNDTCNNAMEAKSRGAFIIGISDRESTIYDYWIKIPKVSELLYPMFEIIPLQLLAYYMAVSRGLNPDCPRSLAKSVTVK